LGKIVDMLFAKGIASPTRNAKWTRAAVDKLLANKKYIPIVGVGVYMHDQFERDRRCNVDYDKAGHPRKATIAILRNNNSKGGGYRRYSTRMTTQGCAACICRTAVSIFEDCYRYRSPALKTR